MNTVYSTHPVEVKNDPPTAPAPSSGSGHATVYAPGQQVQVLDIPTAASGIPQFLLWDDGVRGPRKGTFNHQLTLYWRHYELTDERGGDWLDANGVEQGAVPFATFTVTVAQPLGWLEIDVTQLVRKWVESGRNTGFRIYPSAPISGSANIRFAGRLSENPPKLVVTTDDSVQVFGPGMLASWSYSSLNGIDARQEARLAKLMGFLGRFDDLAVTGTVTSAKLRLFMVGKSTSYPMTAEIYQTNPPEIKLPRECGPVENGLAVQIGEENLDGHADVYTAGDFAQMNVWGRPPADVANTVAKARRTYPSPLFNEWSVTDFASDPNKKLTVEFHPDGIGGTFMRHRAAPGLLGQGSGKLDLSGPDRSDPLLPADPSLTPLEMYWRIYIRLHPDFLDLWEENIKWGLGWEMRYGYWSSEPVGWTSVSGSGQSAGDGKRYLDVARNRYLYKGHSLRYYTGPSCRPFGRSEWFNLISPMQAVSHNPPAMYGSRYAHSGFVGTEETIRLGNQVRGRGVVIDKGKWHCYEQKIKTNSIKGPFDGQGNGTPNYDGELTSWIDGVKIDHHVGFAWRCHPDMGVQGNWIVWYDGGGVPPDGNGQSPGRSYTFDMNYAVMSKQYIGPHPRHAEIVA